MCLDGDAFDLVEADLVGRSVVELGCAWGLVGGDLLRVLQRTAVLEVGGDAGGAEGVAAEERGLDAGNTAADAKHAQWAGSLWSPRSRFSLDSLT